MATFNVQIEKLDANNYSNWAADIKYLLLDKDCWSIVTGTEEIPVLDPDKGITHRDLKEYRLRASTAISTIYLNISPEFRKIIEGTENARVAWDSLKKFFEPDNRSRHMQLFSEFLACKILPGENISLFAVKLLRLQEKLKGINHPIDEDYMCFQLLRYLPSRYDSIVQSILRWSDDKFKFNEIQLELVAEESRLQVRASDNNDEHIEAHSISSYRKSCRKSLVCFHCNRSGHFRNKCPELQKKVPSVSSGFDRIPSTSQDCGRSLPDTSPNPSSNNQRWRRRTKIQNTNPSSHGGKGELRVKENGQLLFKAFLRDGLYVVNPNILNQKRVGFSANSVQKLDARLWHSRLAHIGSHTIQNTVKNKGVRGLKGYVDSNLNCEVCKLYKHRRTSFKATNFVRSKAPNDLIFMDTWGPIKVTGRNGERYYLSIIDDFSKKTSVYPLREKSEVFRVFKNHVSRAERFIGRKVKCIRTDNGSEFANDNFKTFCADNGIKHEFTNIYTPEQNGVAERYNQTALDCSRCMLADGGLDNKFWPDAVLCFTYVWNRICHKNQVKTPFELFGGYKPSVRHLKAFGATAYVGLPRQLRSSKLGPKAKKAFSDSDFAACRDDRVSMGGQIIFIGQAPIVWRTFKEKCISLSTMEAEFIALTEAAKEMTWFDRILGECCDRKIIEVIKEKPTLYVDNLAAIDFVKSPVENHRSRHIDVKLFFIRDLVYKELFELKYVKSKDNLSDIFTKAPTKHDLEKFVDVVFKKNVNDTVYS
ncbi:Retrovirus-related Pol polyprotein from transposon TNT 1-94 [Araneus ventricosus]|uniref:Retrovirus-related Pol polyprotein from transposon TNT 1-94 n=1 Tax=Araneus ventricosus TaxID=182803 RepID=A0A4Y2NXC8_ARAVE|nr:Retrovirus-related Pol polyprotein from transposon TNT 1-94 [Araneus ventricosus]GBN43478.1 Retrovirus-related Pol polyprotein from transposon TNT 1-94 [Araneus ventricosus]